MTNISAAFASFLRPGTRVVETTAGYRVLELASHNAVYMIGSGTLGDYYEPTLVRSLADFKNQFGSSPSEAAIKLYFRNDSSGLVWFVRTALTPESTLQFDPSPAGDYSITIGGTEITVSTEVGDTASDIASKMLAEINISAAAATVTAVAGNTVDTIIIRNDDAQAAAPTITLGDGAGGMTLTAVTKTTPTASDYVAAIENSFDIEEDWPQGYLLAPEAFQLLTDPTDRLAVGTAMEDHAGNEGYDWVAIVDAGPNLTTLAEYKADAERYTTAQGHLAWYGPYVKDLEEGVVPASAGVAGIATKRAKEVGFHHPPAGARYPMQGVLDVVKRFGNQDQDVMNPVGANLVRYLRNKGVCVWAMRSRSVDSFYTFIHTRVIMNVLNGTLRNAFDFEIFSSIDGRGVLMSRMKETAASVCRRMWIGGALFGETESEAFEVVCSLENNTNDNLELGQVLMEVFVAPSPALEKLLVNTIRVPIGQVQEAAAAGRQVEAKSENIESIPGA